MAVSTLQELRLDAFKSVRDGVVPIGPVTLIVGRNGSGKSNVLDGLAVLSALASGADVRDALDGGRLGPVVRGGSEGCAPLGQDSFRIGCVAEISNELVHLELEIRVRPDVQILSERLWTLRTSGNRKGEPLEYLKSDPPTPHSGDIVARWDNGKRGTNPPVTMRANQLMTSQVATRVPATTIAGRRVHEVAEGMLSAISGVFLLDPIPHQMREYVPEKDSRLRRTADNLSAVIRQLLRESEARAALLEMTANLSEAQISDLSSVSSELGDVMVTVEELIGGVTQAVPARLMSDGTLRFLAIAAAMLDSPESSHGSSEGGRILVVEELENGLHPSQAAQLLQRLKAAAMDRSVRTIATTHSPAILDALDGADHASVVVASRDEEGWSRITRLVDFPDYIEILGKDSLGANAVQDRLRPGSVDTETKRRNLRSLFED
ncbi:AAA family ATPase [Plantibacter sp. H53]|uniref:AAA family ATPase n=1 Tax=Plantibacter sp. H53 TaxID=1827323 RepID=UPI0009EF52EB|nr:ATP-binding protein [Plantibacter sp. H53]